MGKTRLFTFRKVQLKQGSNTNTSTDRDAEAGGVGPGACKRVLPKTVLNMITDERDHRQKVVTCLESLTENDYI